jgi:hypothetical protein
MAQQINIKHFFSIMPVKTLKELAMRHNVQTGIKAPSQMLKAELVKSLSDHYINLTGTELLPIQSKKLNIPYTDVPATYRPKNPKKQIADDDPLKELKEWARGFIRVKKAPYEIARENREARALQYATERKLKEAIKKRETRQAKEKQKRLNTKEDKSKANKQKTQQIQPEKPDHPFLTTLSNFYNRVKFAIDKEPNKDGIKYFDDTINKYTDEIVPEFNKIKNKLSQNEKEKANKLFDKIDKILDDDEIISKFEEE